MPLKQKAITDAQTRLESVEIVAIRVDTDAGTSWGFNWNYTKGTRAVKAVVDDNYVPALRREDPLDRKNLMGTLSASNHFIGRVGVTRRPLRGGIFI